jgi:hypothetical protein
MFRNPHFCSLLRDDKYSRGYLIRQTSRKSVNSLIFPSLTSQWNASPSLASSNPAPCNWVTHPRCFIGPRECVWAATLSMPSSTRNVASVVNIRKPLRSPRTRGEASNIYSDTMVLSDRHTIICFKIFRLCFAFFWVPSLAKPFRAILSLMCVWVPSQTSSVPTSHKNEGTQPPPIFGNFSLAFLFEFIFTYRTATSHHIFLDLDLDWIENEWNAAGKWDRNEPQGQYEGRVEV